MEELNSNKDISNKNWNRVSVTRRSLPMPSNFVHQKHSTAKKQSKSNIYENLPSNSFQISEIKNDTNSLRNHFPNRESLVILKHLNTIKSLQSNEPKKHPQKTSKKVEFCKTEVHFTPESGKIEIIETEKKPIKTLNLRKVRKSNKKLQSVVENNSSRNSNGPNKGTFFNIIL